MGKVPFLKDDFILCVEQLETKSTDSKNIYLEAEIEPQTRNLRLLNNTVNLNWKVWAKKNKLNWFKENDYSAAALKIRSIKMIKHIGNVKSSNQ